MKSRRAMRSIPLLIASIAATGTAYVPIATAQGMLEEIVITARKRDENQQDVPMAVAAFGGDQLENAGISDITEVANLTPNVVMSETSGLVSGAINVFIRGIGSDPGFDQGVGIYVDDVYLNRTSGAILEVYDVDRIEVLKGPQGNLYGRNTIGGAIKYITREPSDETRANIEVSAGNYDLFKVKGSVSGALSDDGLYGGIGFSYKERDGWQKNRFDGKEYNTSDVFALRGTLLWEVNDWTLKLAADYSKDESVPGIPNRVAVSTVGTNGISEVLTHAEAIFGAGTALVSEASDVSLPSDIDSVNSENVSGAFGFNNFEIETKALALTLSTEINDSWTFKSVTAARLLENTQPFDFDGSDQLFIKTINDRDQADYTQEFQFNYTGDSVNGVLGLYYLDGNRENDKPSMTEQTARLRFFDSHTKIMPIDDRDEESASIYGTVDWDFAEDWQLSLGARYTYDSKELKQRATVDQTFYAVALDNGFDVSTIAPGMEAAVQADAAFITWMDLVDLQGPDLTDPDQVNQACVDAQAAIAGDTGPFSRATTCSYREDVDNDESWSEFSPSIRIKHNVNEDTIVYAGISSGYKAGGFETSGGSSSSYDPETVESYTIGLKTTLLDGNLRFNTEAFYNDYTDKQLATITLVNGDLTQRSENVGEVTTSGAEVEVTWAPGLEGLTLIVNGGYLNSEIDKFPSFDSDGDPIDLSKSHKLGFSPEWTGQGRVIYNTELADLGFLTLGTDVSYRTESFTDSPIDATDPFQAQALSEEHAIWNAMIAFQTQDEKWRVALHGKNLEDKRVLVNTFNVSDFITGGYNAPRTWTLSVGYSME